jgi:hypothetical protein
MKKIISKIIKSWLQRLRQSNRFLCDTCKYDYRGACSNPNRPNVKSCSDYKKR